MLDMPGFCPLPPDLPPVTVRVSARARRMALRLDPAARQVHLIVPARSSLTRAYEFARTHAGWIDRRLAALPAAVPFVAGATLPIFGRPRTIRVVLDSAVRATEISLEENEILVRTSRAKAEIAGRLRRQMACWAQEALEGLARQKACRIGARPGAVKVRETKSRWGSCSPEGDLNFSWRLIFAPPAVMDYVVAHEVAHMRHMNHGPAFWALCRDLSVDFLAGRRWIRTNGADLMRYGVSDFSRR